jgi:hypothetical protein
VNSPRGTCPLRILLKRAPWLIFCLTTLGSLAAGQVAASRETLSLREYIAELDHCSALVANRNSDPSALRSLRLSLPTTWTGNAGDQSFIVSTNWLAESLAEIESNPHKDSHALAQVQQRLVAYRNAAQALEAQNPVPHIELSRATLNKILEAKEFQAIQAPSWLDMERARLYAWIGRQFDKLFKRIGLRRSIGNLIAWIVIAMAALLMLLWAVRAFHRAGSRPEMELRGAAAMGRDWLHWLRDARDAAGRADYRSAIHAAYWAAVVRLEETKTLPEDRSRTPRESLRLLRTDSAEYAPLSQLTRRFELVWYGCRSATAADWADALQQLETLGCLRPSIAAISVS